MLIIAIYTIAEHTVNSLLLSFLLVFLFLETLQNVVNSKA